LSLHGSTEFDAEPLADVLGEPIDWRAKGFAAHESSLTIRDVRVRRPSLFGSEFATPVAALLADPLERNIERMAHFCRDNGVEIAPHAKTALSPQVFARQLDHGAWGVAVATPWQARLCAHFGVRRILLANELVDVAAARWMTGATTDDIAFLSYVDSPEQVEQMSAALAEEPAARPLDVLLEIGWPGGRGGCRTDAATAATVRAVAASRSHRLVGVAGFEGILGSDACASTLEEVTAFLRRMRTVAERLAGEGAFERADPVILSAGGSGYFDLVVRALAGPLPGGRRASVILRSGGYLSADAPPYDEVSPFVRDPELSARYGMFEPAIEVWTRVLSRPEPGLALLDAGKRDLPIDRAMPVPTHVRRGGAQSTAPSEWQVRAANDQHAYLRLAGGDELQPGDLVSLSVVHPCTLFDKWSWLPVVNADYEVVDVVRTYF
jgi:D-serine deaminase-like pyridoxal phosphate-dependent protein